MLSGHPWHEPLSQEYVFLQVSHMYILEVEITDNTIEISNPGSDKVETYDASRDIRGENIKLYHSYTQPYPKLPYTQKESLYNI